MDASTLRFIMELADLLGKAPCIPVPVEDSVSITNAVPSVHGKATVNVCKSGI